MRRCPQMGLCGMRRGLVKSIRKKIESYIDYGVYSYSLPSDGYTCVAVVDGLLMATAYNLSWNTQELKYFDFYDAFQSMEF